MNTHHRPPGGEMSAGVAAGLEGQPLPTSDPRRSSPSGAPLDSTPSSERRTAVDPVEAKER